MPRRLRPGTAALVVILLGHATLAVVRAEEIDGRKLVAARETIRAELSAAVLHGELSRMDQYRILLHAKEILPPEDVRGLEQWMDRRASKTQPAPAADTPASTGADRATLASYAADASGKPGSGEPTLAPKPDGPLGLAAEPTGAAKPGEPPGPGFAVSFQPVDPTQQAVPAINGDAMFTDCPAGLLGGDGCFKDNLQSVWHQTWSNLSLFSAIEAFKGPEDLVAPNGNFGVGFGMNAGIPLSYPWGLGVQVGLNTTVTDFQGTFSSTGITDTPTSTARSQLFTTLGLFQRVPFYNRTLVWAFTHDWLQDDYYERMHFAEWRVKLGIEWSPCNETGLWAAMPDHGFAALVAVAQDQPFVSVDLRPLAQGSLYWKHVWCSGASTTAWVGVAKEPLNFVLGGDARIPIADHLSLIGEFTYITPRSAGAPGQFDDTWNVTFGLEFVPGGAHHCMGYRFAPPLPVADNGNFAIQAINK